VDIVHPDERSIQAIGPSLMDHRRRAQVTAAAYAQGRAMASG